MGIFREVLVTCVAAVFSVGPPDPCPAALEARLELMRQDELFWELSQDGLTLYAGGWPVKQFSAEAIEWSYCHPGPIARVEEVFALRPPRSVVVDAETLARASEETTGSVSSEDQIVSVADMPESFAIRWDEGTWWLVNFYKWSGWSGQRRRIALSFKLAGDLLESWWAGRPIRVVDLRCEGLTARELYWSLRVGSVCVQ